MQGACVPCPGMSSVWMLVWEWGTSSASPSPDTLAPEEAPGTGLPVDACALRSTTAFRDWLLWFSIIRSRVISWHSKSRIKNLWILWIQSHLERTKLKDWKSKETFCLLSDCKINLCEQRDSSTKWYRRKGVWVETVYKYLSWLRRRFQEPRTHLKVLEAPCFVLSLWVFLKADLIDWVWFWPDLSLDDWWPVSLSISSCSLIGQLSAVLASDWRRLIILQGSGLALTWWRQQNAPSHTSSHLLFSPGHYQNSRR